MKEKGRRSKVLFDQIWTKSGVLVVDQRVDRANKQQHLGSQGNNILLRMGSMNMQKFEDFKSKIKVCRDRS